ncbi:MAG TPA: hypothetical protein P5277_00630 [Candidatus Paceibacterota bacterium]|nr:hypothetical protein [Candidatus Paceibacterota bacterium]
MNIKTFYIVLSLFSIILGAFLLINAEVKTLGAIIGIRNVSPSISLIFGLTFLFLGFALFIIEKRIKSNLLYKKH